MVLKAVQRTTGDPIADRRYAYACAAFAEADWQAAVDMASQTIELAPAFVPAYALMGRALAALQRPEPAIEALKEALERDPADELGVKIDLARLGALDPGDAMSAAYIRALFDQYAESFDQHLTQDLHYRGPDILKQAVLDACASLGRPPSFDRAIDLGCGTGLVGKAFAGMATRFSGVDLSPAMIESARETGVYTDLHVQGAVDYLLAAGKATADLILAADTLVYFGDLFPVFREVAEVLEPGGMFAFTVQEHGGPGFILGHDARYAHADSYLKAVTQDAGLSPILSRVASTRTERGFDQPGQVVVLQRP